MFSYMGSKWRLARKYGPPQTNLIVEPFAGGACYSLYWNAPKVILYDLNPVIAGIWQYLIKVKESEILALPVDFETVDDLRISQEAKWLIGFWLGKGRSTPGKSRSAWARQFNHTSYSAIWCSKRREKIAQQLANIRDWKIYCADYRECPDVEADWFVDPPYSIAGKCYKFSDVNYEELARFCLSRKGRLTVCENDGADWLPFKPFAAASGTHGKVRTGVSFESVYQQSS
jgi:site-specific DNA-adenine methylase